MTTLGSRMQFRVNDSKTIKQTPTVTAGAYTAGDAVGGKLTFDAAARANEWGGAVTNVRIIDDAGQDVELELWLFSTDDYTAVADNAPWSATEADLHNFIAVISTADLASSGYKAAGTPSVVDIECTKFFQCESDDDAIYGHLVTRGTPTFVATDDVTVIITITRD